MPSPTLLPRRAGPAVLLVVVAVLALGSACSRSGPSATAPIPGTTQRGLVATVVHVVDGDTVDLQVGSGSPERVRLLGIDTPETVKPDAPVDCFGPEASARTKALLPDDTAVLIRRDAEARDRYGRLLAYVWRRADGLFVNRSLVVDGFARTLSIAPNTAHRVDLSAAQAQASATATGLWGACPADAEPRGP